MVLKTNEKEIIWLAGFIDGEGYIGIERQRKKETSKQSASLVYHPYLIISNSNYDIVKFIRELVGYSPWARLFESTS